MKDLYLSLTLLCLMLGTAASVQAQDNIPYAGGGLQWNWVPGTAPNNGTPTEYHLHCGTVSGSYTMPIVVVRPVAPSTVPPRSINLSQFLPGPSGIVYYCTVTAYNPLSVPPESDPSNEYPFVAVGAGNASIAAPTNLRGRSNQ